MAKSHGKNKKNEKLELQYQEQPSASAECWCIAGHGARRSCALATFQR